MYVPINKIRLFAPYGVLNDLIGLLYLNKYKKGVEGYIINSRAILKI